MSRKSDKKIAAPKTKSSIRNHPSMAWLPAFFAGLILGLLVHFIPGMHHFLEHARTSQQPEKPSVAEERPVMWRPYRSSHH